ncbi:MAG TPA: NAD(P)H-binding protein [Anaerolineales bacterium]|nr:NAD(P)H-binding protein [Anaerolineales bacterium]
MDRLILVTGATGYIASRLIPRLLEAGYRVRCLAREPLRLTGRSWFRYVEVVRGDVMTPSTLRLALEGVHAAYYLIHNMSYGRGYTALELDSARAFASAAEAAGVEHIIYLGGLADPEQHIAPHMRSRIETGHILRQGNVPVTEFRAGVIIGSGSISFEMIRFMTELCPVVPGPVWMKNKSQPIAIRNVIDYLLAALTNPDGRGGIFEIGGPDVLPYGDLMLGYARIRRLKRRMILLPGIPLWFMALGVDWMTPVPYPIAYALIDGLSADSLVKYPEALKIFPNVKLIDFDSATREALEKTQPAHIERMWEDGERKPKSIKHEGCFIDHREVAVQAEPEKVLRTIARLVERQGWVVESKESNQRIIAYMQNQAAGKKWIEWRVRHAGSVSYVAQTVFFSPSGLPGFLYWYLYYPFHINNERGFIQSIARQSGIQ